MLIEDLLNLKFLMAVNNNQTQSVGKFSVEVVWCVSFNVYDGDDGVDPHVLGQDELICQVACLLFDAEWA